MFRDLIGKRKDGLELEFGSLIFQFLNALVMEKALVLKLMNLTAEA